MPARSARSVSRCGKGGKRGQFESPAGLGMTREMMCRCASLGGATAFTMRLRDQWGRRLMSSSAGRPLVF